MVPAVVLLRHTCTSHQRAARWAWGMTQWTRRVSSLNRNPKKVRGPAPVHHTHPGVDVQSQSLIPDCRTSLKVIQHGSD